MTLKPPVPGQSPINTGYADGDIPRWTDDGNWFEAAPGLERSSKTDERIIRDTTSTFSADFTYSAISSNQDGWLVAKNLTINAGFGGDVGEGGSISYFKLVGASIVHNGEGNLDVFWASVAHHGDREAGLFIGDITGDAGGNVYGGHVRVISEDVAPLFHVGWLIECVPNVAQGGSSTYYGVDVQNNGSEGMDAAIQIEASDGTAAVPFSTGINFDISASDATATAIRTGGTWGSAFDANGNSMTNVNSIASTGSSPNRDVRLVDNLVLDNARHIKFKDSGGTARKTVGVTSSDHIRLIQPGASSQVEFYNNTEGSLLARITSSGRGDFSTGGVTSKYTSGTTQPAYLTNGQIEVWHDTTGGGTSYLVVNVNGSSKKVAVT